MFAKEKGKREDATGNFLPSIPPKILLPSQFRTNSFSNPISKLISFDFSTLHSPRIPSFCYSSHRFDRKTVVKTSSEKFLVGSTQKIILPARNILTLLCLFRQLEGTKVSWEAVTFNLPPGLNTSRRVPEKKKRFTKTLRKDYITIFKEIFVVNFPCSSYFPRST